MVLARYNAIAKTTAGLMLAAFLGLPFITAGLIMGPVDLAPYAFMAAMVWLGSLLVCVSAVRAVRNMVLHGGRAVYVQDGRLHYDAPGMLGSLKLSPADIVHARATVRKRFAATPARSAAVKPVWVVEVGRASGKPRNIEAYALDVTPETLAAGITDFAAGKMPPGLSHAIVR